MSEKCSTCRKWVMKHYFDGYPKKEDLELVEEKLAPLQDGGKVSPWQLFLLFMNWYK